MYSLLLALIYIAFISLGLPDSLLGACWPVAHASLGVSISSLGIITTVISGGTIVSSLLSDKLTHRFGTAIVTVFSVFLTAVALLGFSLADRFWMIIVFAVPYGLGAGAIDAALNNYVALHYTSKHMSWLHCFWGVGTIISPLVMSAAITRGVWNDGYRTVAFIQLGICLLLLLTLPVWKTSRPKGQAQTAGKSPGLASVLRIKGVPFLLLGFLAYCAAESTAMHWASTYMTEVKGLPPEQAAGYASLFFIGMTAGRFVAGFIMNRLGDRKMILLGTCVVSCSLVALLLPVTEPALSLAAFVVLGLGCAPIYPCIIHSTPANFGAENSGAIIGIQMASAYLGSTLSPPLYGVLGKALGFGILPVYMGVFVLLMIVMTELTFRIAAKKTIPPSASSPEA